MAGVCDSSCLLECFTFVASPVTLIGDRTLHSRLQ
jgi:hypothetical protein